MQKTLKAAHKEGTKIKDTAIQSLKDKVKKTADELKKHKKEGYDGQGSSKRKSYNTYGQTGGFVKVETATSKKYYGPWKRKKDNLEKQYDTLVKKRDKALKLHRKK